jgi:hypothetical protein
MPNPPSRERSSPQFTLLALFVFIALAALPLTLAHYFFYGSDFSAGVAGGAVGILVVAIAVLLLIAAPLFIIVGLAYLWNQRAQKPTFGGLVLRVVAVCAAIFTMVCLIVGLSARW